MLMSFTMQVIIVNSVKVFNKSTIHKKIAEMFADTTVLKSRHNPVQYYGPRDIDI